MQVIVPVDCRNSQKIRINCNNILPVDNNIFHSISRPIILFYWHFIPFFVRNKVSDVFVVRAYVNKYGRHAQRGA